MTYDTRLWMAALSLLIAPAAMASGLQITTDWHEEPVNDPDNQLIAGPIAAAVRTQDHIYELHLMCGHDQYGGSDVSARASGTVLELAVSTFHSDESPASIKTRPGDADGPGHADIRLTLGNGHSVTQAFRSDGHPNVISRAWDASANWQDDDADTSSNASTVGHQLAQASATDSQITISRVLGYESASIPLTDDNPVLKHFIDACPVTR